ncbi:hypothetical protein IP91_03833 [Pseudoduganella lurida]|uniref:Glycosyltransferase n=1 Tax=Pseudoduganella lurida TaxID=1036180 RepID=A0A562R2D9_9BURK|nr:glycosyltransferase family 2 protein [Pseudoduganella lurida]TWI62993.1 hypothetical protein IP91_03833 [Pseudoduganella lurida]
MTHRILVSILNWNGAARALQCVRCLLRQSLPPDARMDILVIDNGSAADDAEALAQGLAGLPVTLRREAINHGFAGGHNLAIAQAFDEGHDFAWLVNSDATMAGEDVLAQLLALMDSQPCCAAASPVLALPDRPEQVYFCGTFHDWPSLATVRARDAAEARRLAVGRAAQQWVPGTALLLRTAALRTAGLLDERLFAYYEDDELCTRLATHGWHCAVAYGARVLHDMPPRETDRPAYYFYLMARNHLRFWHGSTPAPHRRALGLKLLDRALYDVNRLHHRGFPHHARAALLGVEDFLRGRHGRPVLERSAGLPLRLVCRLLRPWHARVLSRTW